MVVSFFAFEMATFMRAIGTERVNRKTNVSIEGPQLTVELVLPKGVWQIHVADDDESIEGVFELNGDIDDIRGFSSSKSGAIFHTERDFTRVVVACKFQGDYEGKFLEIRAIF